MLYGDCILRTILVLADCVLYWLNHTARSEIGRNVFGLGKSIPIDSYYTVRVHNIYVWPILGEVLDKHRIIATSQK